MAIITSDSIPDYDNWGIDDYWSCTDWINWHKTLKAKLGKPQADQVWLTAWNKQDFFEHNLSWCKYASSFNDYVKNENLAVSHLLADTFSGVTNIGENLVDSATATSKVIKYLIPGIIIVAAIGLLFYFVNKYKLLKFS